MLETLDLLSTPADLLIGAPMLLLLDSIDEDPDQPRKEFDPDKLAELAETIRVRGVRQPVSVRRHPVHADRWILNFGARRLRASRLVGKTDIPAFVDNSPDSYDQVIENEQRENLTPLDLALFVKRRLAAGETQAEIARQMGKSRAFVTMACSMIDPPDAVMVAYRSGRCRGLTELYQLTSCTSSSRTSPSRWSTRKSRSPGPPSPRWPSPHRRRSRGPGRGSRSIGPALTARRSRPRPIQSRPRRRRSSSSWRSRPTSFARGSR